MSALLLYLVGCVCVCVCVCVSSVHLCVCVSVCVCLLLSGCCVCLFDCGLIGRRVCSYLHSSVFVCQSIVCV